jgi:hypothetical protein
MARFVALLTLALVLAPGALADGFVPAAEQNGDGVVAPDGSARYVAVGTPGTETTMLARIDPHTGTVAASVPLVGRWGIPIFTYAPGSGEGLSADGRTLVLADISNVYPREVSGFMFVDPRTLHMRDAFVLKGDFEFDALAPDGKRLYLIEHTDVLDQTHYVVRAYDLAGRRLLPGRVADRTQRGWVMEGYPIARTATPDGRWVYTLYGNPRGFPFVHALDTTRGVAHCVGLPWRGKQNAVYNLRLTLHGGALAVHWLSGRPWLRMDTTSWRLSADHGSGFPWWMLSLVLVPLGLVPAVRWIRDRTARRLEVVRDAAGAPRGGSRNRPDDRDGGDGRSARSERRRQVDDARHGARAAAP